LHNQYFVMTWDFSAVSPQGDVTQIRETLHRYINTCIQNFAVKYQHWLPVNISIEPADAQASFQSLLTAVQQTPYRLYLLIDEYDNFANELMIGHRKESPSRYQTLLSGEGALKALFKAVKAAASGRGLERVFITGVSPVVLTDMSSGYNVAENIYLRHEFNDLCGFLETEIVETLNQVAKECDFSEHQVQQALLLMRSFYNGYCFSQKSKELIYNPTLALYFIKSFQQDCEFPNEMLDENLAMDRGKLTYISELPKGEQVIVQAINNEPLTLTRLANRFGVEDMLSTVKDTRFMISLLYYFGILTLNGKTEWGEFCFKIPNLVVRSLYVERLFDRLLPQEEREEVQLMAKRFYQTGDLQPICDFMEQRYFKVFDNRDYRIANELTIKTAFLTLLFDDIFYIVDSETEVEKRYADLTFIIRPEQRSLPLYDFILEFKYLGLKEMGLSSEKLRKMRVDELFACASVKQKLTESKQQLLDYKTRLQSKSGEKLRLQLISVVAMGFERVVWQRV
ncbi:MAG: AAA family ATPase, partial [Thiomargarita sp.]|nr:AAA family ATPase [Thiomargarita sp.]